MVDYTSANYVRGVQFRVLEFRTLGCHSFRVLGFRVSGVLCLSLSLSAPSLDIHRLFRGDRMQIYADQQTRKSRN